MNPLLQNPLTIDTSDPSSASDVLRQWQEMLLRIVLLATSISCILFSFFTIVSGESNSKWFLFSDSFFIALCSAALLISHRPSYRFRSIITLILFYSFTLLLFYRFGWNVPPILLLIVFSMLFEALTNKLSMCVGWGISVITLSTWVFLSYTTQSTNIVQKSLPNLIIEALLILLAGLLGNWIVYSLHHKLVVEITHIAQMRSEANELNEKIKKSDYSNLTLLKTTTELSQIALSSLDQQALLKNSADLLQNRLNLFFVGIFLIDLTREYAVLHYGTGEPGSQMLFSSYRLAIGGYSIIAKAIQSRQVKSSLENNSDLTLSENPFLLGSKNEFVLPLISRNEVIGALDIHTTEPNLFEEKTQNILTQAADILSLALQNYSIEKIFPQSKQQPHLINNPSNQTLFDEKTEINITYSNPSFPQDDSTYRTHQVPIKLKDEVIGFIDIETKDKELSQDQNDFLKSISEQISIALKNASLFDQTHLQAERERKILEITSRIRSTNDSKQMLQITLEELSRNLGISKAQIVLNVPESPQKEEAPNPNTKLLNKKPTTGKLSES